MCSVRVHSCFRDWQTTLGALLLSVHRVLASHRFCPASFSVLGAVVLSFVR